MLGLHVHCWHCTPIVEPHGSFGGRYRNSWTCCKCDKKSKYVFNPLEIFGYNKKT